jgi:hypothetical protein
MMLWGVCGVTHAAPVRHMGSLEASGFIRNGEMGGDSECTDMGGMRGWTGAATWERCFVFVVWSRSWCTALIPPFRFTPVRLLRCRFKLAIFPLR